MNRSTMFYFYAIIAILSVLITACSDEESMTLSTPTTPIDQQILLGSWEGDCLEIDTIPGEYAKKTVIFTQDNYIEETGAYLTDSTCSEIHALWIHTYTYDVPSAYLNNGDLVNHLNLTFINTTHTMKTQVVTDYWNGQPGGFCNYTNWIVDVAIDVTGQDCDFNNSTAGDTLFDIFSVDTGVAPQVMRFSNRVAEEMNRPNTVDGASFEKL